MQILKIQNPKGRAIEIAMSRGRDMIGTTQAYEVCAEGMLVPEGDYNGLTNDEVEALEHYTYPETEDIR